MAYDKTLGYDPDIKDYSALIANTTDASTRAALLEQRQNKLDHLESTGGRDAQWADNSVVLDLSARRLERRHRLLQPLCRRLVCAGPRPHGGRPRAHRIPHAAGGPV